MNEYEFFTYAEQVCAGLGYGKGTAAFSYITMICIENGSDCGSECYEVAKSTLDMAIDDGTVHAMAKNEF